MAPSHNVSSDLFIRYAVHSISSFFIYTKHRKCKTVHYAMHTHKEITTDCLQSETDQSTRFPISPLRSLKKYMRIKLRVFFCWEENVTKKRHTLRMLRLLSKRRSMIYSNVWDSREDDRGLHRARACICRTYLCMSPLAKKTLFVSKVINQWMHLVK